MESEYWWIWVVFGILLIVFEIFTAGFIVLWFGIAAIITALPVYFGASAGVIIATYGVSILILTVHVRKITIDMMSKRSKMLKTNADAVLGSLGVVVEEVDPIQGTGQVRVGKEIWTAHHEGSEKLAVNTQVKVLRIEGAKIIVRKENI